MSDKDVTNELELKRGGPSTPEGKAVVSRNAIKHGILAGIIPDHEAEAYEVHVKGVHDDYWPVGYMEEALTERIATSLWRLGRVMRYENATVDEDTRRGIDNLHNLIKALPLCFPTWVPPPEHRLSIQTSCEVIVLR